MTKIKKNFKFIINFLINNFKFNSGKLKNSWNNNVISIGLAYHFLEPLQATNIHLTLVQLDVLCQKYISNTKENTLNKSIISSYNKFIDSLIENFFCSDFNELIILLIFFLVKDLLFPLPEIK